MSLKFEFSRKSVIFTILVLAVSYFFMGLWVFLDIKWTHSYSLNILITLLIYMFIPSVMALFVQTVLYKQPIAKPLYVSFKLNRWFIIALLFPPFFALITVLVGIAFPDINYESALTMREITYIFLKGLVAGATINALTGLGEELGWRGLLFSELSHNGFWKSSVAIGIIWGVWHFPLITELGLNYPEHRILGMGMMVIFTILVSPLLSFLVLRSKSILTASVFHGSLNAFGGLPLVLTRGGNDLTSGVTGLAGVIVLVIINIGLFLHLRYYKNVYGNKKI